MKHYVFIPVFLLLFVASAHAETTSWLLDKAHTEIGFSVKHLGVSKVKGEFREFNATVTADKSTGKLSSIDATVYVQSIDTGIEKRDAHLKADDFFSQEKYPKMTLKSEKITFNKDKVVIEALLTIRDKTKKVTFTGEYYGVNKANMGAGEQLHSGYSLSTTINRQDFGLKFAALAEGVSVVSDDVVITIDAEIIRKL